MNDHIREISLLEYLTKFASLRTALSDFYIKSRQCRILGIADGDSAGKGLLLAEPGDVTEILFIRTAQDDPALKKELLNGLKAQLPSGSMLRWRLNSGDDNESFALKYGFSSESVLNIFHTVGAEDPNVQALLPEYEKLCREMESQGYRTVSFAELSMEQLAQIRNNPDGEFESYLCPEAFIDSPSSGISFRMSFAALKDGKVIAYSIVRSPDGKSFIFEIICVAKSKRKQGLFVLPFFGSFREIRAAGAESAIFAVYESNSHMLHLVKERFAPLIASRTVQHSLVYTVH